MLLGVPVEVRPLPPRGTVMAEPFPPESIHQRFAYGLRFVTELEYRVKGANGRRKYRRLLDEPSPLVPHPRDAGGGWTCAALGAAVLLEAEVEPLDGLAAQEAPEEQEEQGVEQIADVLSRLLPDYRMQVHGPQLLPYWGGVAHSTLAGKGIALTQLVVKSQVRWSLVVGSQWCTAYGFPITQRPALLLLDVGRDPVWGLGHNARLAPAGPGYHAEGNERRPSLALETLDGGSIVVSPGALLTVEPRRVRS